MAQTYPSHGFVIDMDEVSHLFERVREASDSEKSLVASIGRCCHFPETQILLTCVTDKMAAIEAKVAENARPESKSDEPKNGTDKHGKDSEGPSKRKRASPRKRVDEASPAK